jgi:predicted nucleic acid-binding protein
VAQRTVLLDTSFLLALENRKDSHHELAKSLDRELLQQNALCLLHWGILLEIADGYARLGRRTKGLQLLERFENEQRYVIHPITETLLDDALSLYRARPDKEWGLTDCVSFVLMKQEGVTEALTADIHFRQAGFTALLLENS